MARVGTIWITCLPTLFKPDMLFEEAIECLINVCSFHTFWHTYQQLVHVSYQTFYCSNILNQLNLD